VCVCVLCVCLCVCVSVSVSVSLQIGERAVSVRDGIHWTTGGGFSNFTATQSWQADAVKSYIRMAFPVCVPVLRSLGDWCVCPRAETESAAGRFPPTQYFNQSGRAYPDVVTIGHNLLIRWGKGSHSWRIVAPEPSPCVCLNS
jgi:hypothetical protein